MKQKLVIFLILLIIPFYVKADTINLSCPDKVNSNTEFSCEVTGTTKDAVSDLSFNIGLSSNLSFVTFVKANSWSGEGDKDKVGLYSGSYHKDTFKIGVLKLKISDNNSATLVLKDVFFYNEEKTYNVDTVYKSINIITNDKQKSSSSSGNSSNKPSKSNNPSSSSNDENKTTEDKTEKEYEIFAFLDNIKIKGYTIDFRKDVFNYDLKIKDEDKLEITPVVSDENITYKVYGNNDLKNGSIIYIECSYGNDEDTQTYNINIIKDEKKKTSFTPLFISIILVLVMFNIVRILFSKNKNESN